MNKIFSYIEKYQINIEIVNAVVDLTYEWISIMPTEKLFLF